MRLVHLGDESMKKYVPASKEISQEIMENFVQDYLDGKLQVRPRYLISLLTLDLFECFLVVLMFDD